MTYRTNSKPFNEIGEKLTGYGNNRTDSRQLSGYLARQDEWHMGSMWASAKDRNSGGLGKLLPVYYESVRHADYIVWSYDTPIAWFTYGMWYMPDKTYSPTTSKHQGRIKVALSAM